MDKHVHRQAASFARGKEQVDGFGLIRPIGNVGCHWNGCANGLAAVNDVLHDFVKIRDVVADAKRIALHSSSAQMLMARYFASMNSAIP
ncbi:hypothetical protein [Mesorhizobium sp.]|uniref:hypothetical protein n=1 Tax=Mesorhizobium sp. TaxID=1871066 RepID=UPI0025808645|nr:hypothetical protein [Mesorhizobium sp.]